ncbi:MAG: hypothetical protein IKN04_17500, partial [Clostridia bacterium]|nr:hypothetical protein [Clostridia bacterium]
MPMDSSAISIRERRLSSDAVIIRRNILRLVMYFPPLWLSWKGDEPSMTACGGNIIDGEISRNKQSSLCGVAPIEAAEL